MLRALKGVRRKAMGTTENRDRDRVSVSQTTSLNHGEMSAVESLLRLHGGSDEGAPAEDAATEQQPRNPSLPELQRLTIEGRPRRLLSASSASQIYPQAEHSWEQYQSEPFSASSRSSSSSSGLFESAAVRANTTGPGELRVTSELPDLHARHQGSCSKMGTSNTSSNLNNSNESCGASRTASSSSGSNGGSSSANASSGRNNCRGSRYFAAPASIASSQVAPSTLFETISVAFSEGRARRGSQDGSEGGAPSAEVTDDENESGDEGSVGRNRRRPRSARSRDSNASDNSNGNRSLQSSGNITGADHLVESFMNERHRSKVVRRQGLFEQNSAADYQACIDPSSNSSGPPVTGFSDGKHRASPSTAASSDLPKQPSRVSELNDCALSVIETFYLEQHGQSPQMLRQPTQPVIQPQQQQHQQLQEQQQQQRQQQQFEQQLQQQQQHLLMQQQHHEVQQQVQPEHGQQVYYHAAQLPIRQVGWMPNSGDNKTNGSGNGSGGNGRSGNGSGGGMAHPAEALFRSFDLTIGPGAPYGGPNSANNGAPPPPSSAPGESTGPSAAPAPQVPQPRLSSYYPVPFVRLPLMNFLGGRSSHGNNGHESSNLAGPDPRQQQQQMQQFQQQQLLQLQQQQWQLQLQQQQQQQQQAMQQPIHPMQAQQQQPNGSNTSTADRPGTGGGGGGGVLRPAGGNSEPFRGQYYLPPHQNMMYPGRFNDAFPQVYLPQHATSQGSIDVNAASSSSSSSLSADGPRAVTPHARMAPPGSASVQQFFHHQQQQQQQQQQRQAQFGGGAVVRGRAEFLLPSTRPMVPPPRLPPGLSPSDMLPHGDYSAFASGGCGGGGGGGGNGAGSARPASGSMIVAQKLTEMPKFKKRPIGRTGHRFILEHSFVTKSGNTYSGFSLQYPKVFGFRSEKSKDMNLLVSNRNAKMTRWAELNTTLDASAISAWVAALDEGGAGATGGN